MPNTTTLNENTRTPLDGTEWYRLATTGANWKAQGGTQTFVFQGIAGGSAVNSSLTLESTTAAGTSDGIFFLIGSQSEAMRIDTNGKVTITWKGSPLTGAPGTSPLNVNGNGVNSGLFEISNFNSIQPVYNVNVTASAVDSHTQSAIAAGTGLGAVRFKGSDGVAYRNSASFGGISDGAFSSGSAPGCAIALTTPSASTTLVERFRIDSVGMASFENTAGFGYGFAGNGDGGTVTQATSKATGVTLNTVNGQITMNAAALASATNVSFTFTNSKITANDYLYVQHQSAGTAGAYQIWASVMAAGSCTITVRNATAGSLSEALVIGFFLVKGATT